jgi:hypothetical protein
MEPLTQKTLENTLEIPKTQGQLGAERRKK